MAHLVTGYGGAAHITPGDDGAFNAAMIGTGDYVLPIGEQFKAQIITNNSVRIYDGSLIMQGRHVNIPDGTYEDVTIANGAQDVNRHDLIVMRYSKDMKTGVETAELAVVQGAATSGDASDPAVTAGSIFSGEELREMPLYRVSIAGLTIESVTALFEVSVNLQTVSEVQAELTKLLNDLTKYLLKTGGTLSGGLEISQATGEARFKATRTDTGAEVSLRIATDGTVHGVYSGSMGQWLIYSDGENCYVSAGKGKLYSLGEACAKAVTDSASAAAIGTGTSLPTERDIYYGLPTINGSHTYNSNTNIYAPTSAGASGQIPVSNGSGAPTWKDLDSLAASTGSFTVSTGSASLTVKKRAGVVTVSGYITPGAAGVITVGTIASGFRPAAKVYGVGQTNPDTEGGRLGASYSIDTSGVLKIANGDATNVTYLSITYVTA